jgi:enoyl-CoA hydratase
MTVEELEPGIALLTLRRPERLNALTWATIEELHATLARVGADPAIRVLALTGEGRGFCSGLDIVDQDDPLGTRDAIEDVYARQERVAGLALALQTLPQPVIAAVNGPAAGGGLALALAADVRLATPAATFTASFVRLGLSACDVGVSYLLPRLVGLGAASELMLTGRTARAEEAARIGLVNAIAEPDVLLGTAAAIARDVTRNAPLGVRMTKEVLQRNVSAGGLAEAIAVENRTQALLCRTDDAAEALAAFRERRPARYGRG